VGGKSGKIRNLSSSIDNSRTEGSKAIENSYYNRWSPDSSVGIATRYGLNGQGSIPGMGKVLPSSTASTQALRPTQPPIQWAPRLFHCG
jgi:hypothetical protein